MRKRKQHDEEQSSARRVSRPHLVRRLPGQLPVGNGPCWVDLFVQFPHVEATVEAFRLAELDRDYSRLHALADLLALPIDEWLAPGEREVVRGVADPPAGFRVANKRAAQKGGAARQRCSYPSWPATAHEPR
ncbi:hypothetical protein ACWGJW_00475 [Streptomyces nigrescens]